MTPAAFAGLLAGGQLQLIAPDLFDSRAHRNGIYGADRANGGFAPQRPAALLACAIGVVALHAGGFRDYVVHRSVNHNRVLWFTHEYCCCAPPGCGTACPGPIWTRSIRPTAAMRRGCPANRISWVFSLSAAGSPRRVCASDSQSAATAISGRPRSSRPCPGRRVSRARARRDGSCRPCERSRARGRCRSSPWGRRPPFPARPRSPRRIRACRCSARAGNGRTRRR